MSSLRSGFTTGAAMTAGALAVFLRQSGTVQVITPDRSTLTIPVDSFKDDSAVIRKDAGDDPDATDGAHIEVLFRPAELTEAQPQDYTETAGELTVIVRGGDGVGLVTRPGLAVPVGKHAINPGPRRLLMNNLLRCGATGTWLLRVAVREGRVMAEKTLNPVLGVTGGISILGGGGVVKPYSNAAYAATIALQMRTIAKSGFDTAAVVTGGRTETAVLRDFPVLEKMQVVRIADFIAHSLRAASAAGIRRIIIGCMPGKLLKYACGDENTHAHKTKLRPALIRSLGIPLRDDLPLEEYDTMGELASYLTAAEYTELLNALKIRALENLQKWAGKASAELALYSDRGERI